MFLDPKPHNHKTQKALKTLKDLNPDTPSPTLTARAERPKINASRSHLSAQTIGAETP